MSSIAFSSDPCQHSYPRRTASFAWKILKKKFLSYNYYLFTFDNLHISRFRRQIIIFDPSRKNFHPFVPFLERVILLFAEREREEKMKEKLADFFNRKYSIIIKGINQRCYDLKTANVITRLDTRMDRVIIIEITTKRFMESEDEQKNSPRIIRFHSVEFRLTLYTRFLQMIKFCLFYASPCF